MSKPPKPIRSYTCGLRWNTEGTTICAPSAGKARYRMLLDLGDCYHGLTFSDIWVRSNRSVVEPVGFRRCVQNRGVPFARIGMRVIVDRREGRIVGHNDSANLDVQFGNAVLNCHPTWEITYFSDSGEVIADFRKEPSHAI
jgi:hypothetical protein